MNVKEIIAILVKSIMEYLVDLKNNKKKTNEKLENHIIFTRIANVKSMLETSFEMQNKGKEAVFKDILKAHISIYEKNLLSIAKMIDNKTIDDKSDLQAKVLKTVNKINDELHNFYMLDSKYDFDEKKVLSIFMFKYEKWSCDTTNCILSRIDNIFSSSFYQDDKKILCAVILDLFLTSIIDTVNNASITLSKINGDLKGLVFKGITI